MLIQKNYIRNTIQFFVLAWSMCRNTKDTYYSNITKSNATIRAERPLSVDILTVPRYIN